MQIEKENKFISFFKRYGVMTVAAVLVIALVAMVAVTASVETEEPEPVTTNVITFTNPMLDAYVTKDYSEELLYNEVLERFEAHLGVDLVSDTSSDVYAVLDGTVSDVRYNSLEGYVVEITHSDGYISTYSSLSSDVLVEEGDSVLQGQTIGTASATAGAETEDASLLHFSLTLNGEDVDPNNYLDLQLK